MFPPGVPGRHCPFLKKEKNPRFLVPLTPSPVSPSLPFLVATGSGSNRANPTGMVQIVQPPWELETNRRSSMPVKAVGWRRGAAARAKQLARRGWARARAQQAWVLHYRHGQKADPVPLSHPRRSSLCMFADSGNLYTNWRAFCTDSEHFWGKCAANVANKMLPSPPSFFRAFPSKIPCLRGAGVEDQCQAVAPASY